MSQKVTEDNIIKEFEKLKKEVCCFPTLFPFQRLTTTEINLLTPVEGMAAYNLTDHKFIYYDGTVWQEI